MRIPKYRKNVSRGSTKGFSVVDGTRIYFPGRYDSHESKAAYHMMISDLERGTFTTQAETPPKQASKEIKRQTVSDLTSKYLSRLLKQYGDAEKSEYHPYRRVFGEFARMFGGKQTDAESEKVTNALSVDDVESFRDHLIKKGNVRSTVNRKLWRLKRGFAWGASPRPYVSDFILSVVNSVELVKKGQFNVKPETKRGIVALETVEETLKHTTSVVAAMVRFQWFTGVRSANVCKLRMCEVDTESDDGVWTWRPERHKTDHLDHDLVIPIGRQAQHAIRHLVENRRPDAYVFSPRESEQERHKTDKPMLHLNPYFVSESYHQSVINACASAAGLKKWIPKSGPNKGKRKPHTKQAILNAGGKYWTPHQLRHSKATLVAKARALGLEAANAALGHSSMKTTEAYAHFDVELAREIARLSG